MGWAGKKSGFEVYFF